MDALLRGEALLPFFSPLSYKLPLDWMFIALCKEQNREVIKPGIACWYLMVVRQQA
jgi:hypothetical protein